MASPGRPDDTPEKPVIVVPSDRNCPSMGTVSGPPPSSVLDASRFVAPPAYDCASAALERPRTHLRERHLGAAEAHVRLALIVVLLLAHGCVRDTRSKPASWA